MGGWMYACVYARVCVCVLALQKHSNILLRSFLLIPSSFVRVTLSIWGWAIVISFLSHPRPLSQVTLSDSMSRRICLCLPHLTFLTFYAGL